MADRRHVALLLAAGTLAGCGDSGVSDMTVVGKPITSWISGQPALTASAQYLTIAVRANGQAGRRYAARNRELILLAAQRLAEKRRARDDVLRRYEEQRRLAAERYRVALRKAKFEKTRQQAELRLRERERRALLARLLEAREVTPGEECSLPEVRAQFDCSTGHIPLGRQT